MSTSKDLENKIQEIIDAKLTTVIHKLAKIDQLEKDVSFYSEKYDSLLKQVNFLNIKSLNDDITRIKASIRNSDSEIKQLKDNINDMEQYTRRECLEIRGIPQQDGEDTNEIVRKVGDLVDIDVKTEDISISHRLQARTNRASKQPKEPSIIVKFARRDVREALYKARSKLRSKSTEDLGFARYTSQKIFIAESLTSRNHQLFNECLKKRNECHYKFIWTNQGKILLRRDVNSPVITIKTEADVIKIT